MLSSCPSPASRQSMRVAESYRWADESWSSPLACWGRQEAPKTSGARNQSSFPHSYRRPFYYLLKIWLALLFKLKLLHFFMQRVARTTWSQAYSGSGALKAVTAEGQNHQDSWKTFLPVSTGPWHRHLPPLLKCQKAGLGWFQCVGLEEKRVPLEKMFVATNQPHSPKIVNSWFLCSEPKALCQTSSITWPQSCSLVPLSLLVQSLHQSGTRSYRTWHYFISFDACF